MSRVNAMTDEATALTRATERAADQYRQTRAVGDLIRLRDERLRCGDALEDVARTAWLPTAQRDYRYDTARHSTGPDIHDLRDLDVDGLKAGLQRAAALELHHVLSAEDAAILAHEFEDLETQIAAFKQVLRQGQGSERTTGSKAVFMPFPDAPDRVDPAWCGAYARVPLLLSPRLSFHVLELLEATGLRRLLQQLFADEVCIDRTNSCFRRLGAHPKPGQWVQQSPKGTHPPARLGLWLALTDTDQTESSPDLDVMLQSDAGQMFRTTLFAGDAVILGQALQYRIATSVGNSTPGLALEMWFCAKSCHAEVRSVAFW